MVLDGFRRVYRYFTADPAVSRKVLHLQASFHSLEALLRINYPSLAVESKISAAESVAELVSGIAERRWTAEDVMRVTVRAAVKAHGEWNAITELLVEDALAEAVALDSRFAVTKELKGPLHGIPIALSDDIDVKGYDSSLGCSCLILRPQPHSAPLVHCLKAAGAILFCKTNVSWHLLSNDCQNRVFGRTANLDDPRVRPAGGCGGVAALVSAGGARLAFGSDTTGDTRVPATNCALFALKPTSSRLPALTPTSTDTLYYDLLPRIPTPIASTTADLLLALQVLLSQPHPTRVPLPFQHQLYTQSPLKIGYYVSDGHIQPTPPARRAVKEATSILTKAGHTLVPFHPPKTSSALILLGKLLQINFSASCAPSITSPLILNSSLFTFNLLMYLFHTHTLVRRVLASFFERVLDDTVAAELVRTWGRSSDGLSSAFDDAWEKMDGMDVVICPVQSSPPLPLTDHVCSPLNTSYASLYNILDRPVGIVPALSTVASTDTIPDLLSYVHRPPDEDDLGPIAQPDRRHRAPKGRNNFLNIFETGDYNRKIGELVGLQMGVQIVGRRFEEERVLAVMDMLQRGIEAESHTS
ncbi:amidase signature domain-containing protein [Phlyctochytrium arcticum]|nr:amidase signature domain-containing protein [Phlyctochytrium arcticum]